MGSNFNFEHQKSQLIAIKYTKLKSSTNRKDAIQRKIFENETNQKEMIEQKMKR